MDLDDPSRMVELRALIRRKGFLRRLYEEAYLRYAACLARCPPGGMAVELGSGPGFVKDVIPGMVTTDSLPITGVDRVVDARRMPFEDESLRAICMMNVFHHIPDVAAFLGEAQRCLKPGGRVFLRDQHVGWLSRLIFGNLHYEDFAPDAGEWRFASTGPVSGANGALAWIVFQRDRDRLARAFPGLKIQEYLPHSFARYWLAGGLKRWSLVPGWSFAAVSRADRWIARASPSSCSFVDIELVRQELPPA